MGPRWTLTAPAPHSGIPGLVAIWTVTRPLLSFCITPWSPHHPLRSLCSPSHWMGSKHYSLLTLWMFQTKVWTFTTALLWCPSLTIRNYHGILYVCVFFVLCCFSESFFPLLNKNLGTFINNVWLNGDREFHLLYETVIKTQWGNECFLQHENNNICLIVLIIISILIIK